MTTFLSYIKFDYLRILRLQNSERVGRGWESARWQGTATQKLLKPKRKPRNTSFTRVAEPIVWDQVRLQESCELLLSLWYQTLKGPFIIERKLSGTIKPSDNDPTEHFTISDRSIDFYELHKLRRPTDFDAKKGQNLRRKQRQSNGLLRSTT